MSLSIDFEPHSWYKGFAIRKLYLIADEQDRQHYWRGVTDDGMTGYIVDFEAYTLAGLKEEINLWYKKRINKRKQQCD